MVVVLPHLPIYRRPLARITQKLSYYFVIIIIYVILPFSMLIIHNIISTVHSATNFIYFVRSFSSVALPVAFRQLGNRT